MIEKQETECCSGASALEPHGISEFEPMFPAQKPGKNISKLITKTKNHPQD